MTDVLSDAKSSFARLKVAEEHAESLRRQLLNDGFHDHVVSVRPVGADDAE